MKASALGAVTVALAQATPSWAAAAAEAVSPSAFAELRSRWTDLITSRRYLENPDAAAVAATGALDRAVAKVLDDIDSSPQRTTVLKSANLAEEDSRYITSTSRALVKLAVAWATPGSQYFGSAEVAAVAVAGFESFLDLRYHPGQPEYGNWWDWESGGGRAVGDFVCIMHSELSKDILNKAAAGMAWFVPDPFKQEMRKDKDTLSEGANRLDLCRASACMAIAVDDRAKLQRSLEGLADTWQLVDQGNGFYPDGSFIQHNWVPYNGSYGTVLLSGLALMFALVSGTELDVDQAGRDAVYARIDEAFVPMIVNGQILDSVRGRSVSRMTEPAVTFGLGIMVAMVQIAERAPQEFKDRWMSTAKGWLERNTYDSFATSNVMHLSALAALRDYPTAAPASITPMMFASTDRLVHRAPGFTAAVAMCSERIAWYEYGNGENELGSRTGLGMRYLYLDDDMGQYEDGFWPTMDYTAPPGTTVDAHPLERAIGKAWGATRPDTDFAGGAVNGTVSAAAMQLLGPDNDGLSAKRTWLCDDTSIVEVVGDVQQPKYQAGTVVEHRNLGANPSQTLVVDGQTIAAGEVKAIANPRWAHLSGVGGYVFVTDAPIVAAVTSRTGTWQNINPARKNPGTEEEITRWWATLQVNHTGAAAEGGAWMVLPGASVADTKAAAESLRGDTPAVKIMKNDAQAQVVTRASGARTTPTGHVVTDQPTAITAFAKGTFSDVTVSAPCLVVTRPEDESHLAVSVADVTQKLDSVTVTLPGQWLVNPATTGARAASESVKATIDGDTTTLVVYTAGQLGTAVQTLLVNKAAPTTSAPVTTAPPTTSSMPHIEPTKTPNADESSMTTKLFGAGSSINFFLSS